MEIKNYKDLEVTETPHKINAYKLYDKDPAQIMHLHLKAGERLKEHITPVDVAIYILEGTPTILVGEKKIVVKKDDIVESPRDIVHCIYNESDKDVRVLVMKLPKPIAKTIIV